MNIYYADEGTKTIVAQITVNGTLYTACSTITYARPTVFTQPTYQWSIDTTRMYGNDADYLGNTPTTFGMNTTPNQNGSTGADVLVENGCDDVFDKPIIIIEGFDPGNKFTIEKLTKKFSSFQFISTLKEYGYDIVYVNFKNNTDYIENNARVLEAIINKVNQAKTGTNKISVIGFSMGGLIARWCLKDMEDGGRTHNVDKYFSYDSTHQGANVPLGFQYFSKEILQDYPILKWLNAGQTTTEPGLGDLDVAYDSPAGRQMMVTKATYSITNYTYGPSTNTVDYIRNAFAARLVAKGYPQQTTNYGIAFGQGNNTTNTKNAGNGKQWNNFNAGDKIFSGSLTALLTNFNVNIWAVPENNNNIQICKYRFAGLTYRTLFGIFPSVGFLIKSKDFYYTGQYPYDDAPGSFEKTQTKVASSLTAPIISLVGQSDTYGHDCHNFVATVSALDLQNQTYNYTNKWQSANMFFNIDSYIQNPTTVNGGGGTLSNTSLSPFSEVITSTSLSGGSNNNQWHRGDLQKPFADFMLYKILGFAPTSDCLNEDFCDLNPPISGPAVICPDGTYHIISLPNTIGIKWESKYGSFAITSGQGTNQVTITKVTNRSDTLILSLTNSCGTTRVIKLGIQVGAGNPPSVTLNYDNICGKLLQAIPYNLATGTTGFNWVVTGAKNLTRTTSTSDTYSGDLVVRPFQSGLTVGNTYYSYLTVQAITDCGLSDVNPYIYNITVGPYSPGNCVQVYLLSTKRLGQSLVDDIVAPSANSLKIYPNPISTMLYVLIPADSVNLHKATITITDISGRQVKQITTVSESNTIPVSTWANGTYVVIITDGKKKIIKKIVKN